MKEGGKLDKYDYNMFGSKGKRVGKAVLDIISTDQPSYTVEDILSEYGKDYCLEFEKTIEENKKKYKSPFYIFVLTKKEFYASNVVRNWFIARQTPPYGSQMMTDYPNHTKTLYIVDADKGELRVLWSIPGKEECKSILKEPQIYSQELVSWILDCYSGGLDKESYSVNPGR